MYRHSPVRSQRSKGIKIKHVLQVCLLVAVCFWLIFQVKRSHDKKKEFDASDTKISLSTRTESHDEVVKLGRKDLQPKLEETAKKHEEEQEQEENKHEDEEQDEDKIDEDKDDGGGGGDDEIDESEQEKSDMEIDREEVDAIDEDKETEESEEKENEEKDGRSQTESGVSVDENDQDGGTRNTREAREEHYKADDASSAVTHDAPVVGIENGNGTLDNSAGNVENTTVIQETSSERAGTTSISIDSHENGPPSNTTVITETDNSSITSSDDHLSLPNSTLVEEKEKTSNSISISEASESNESTGEDDSKTEAETDAGEGETLDSYETKNPEEVEHEAIDLSHLEEKEVRTDLETLPEMETEGGNSEDTAAE